VHTGVEMGEGEVDCYPTNRFPISEGEVDCYPTNRFPIKVRVFNQIKPRSGQTKNISTIIRCKTGIQ